MRSKPELPPLLLRADADAKRGTGHVMRCLALAQAWQSRGGKAVFITRCDSPAVRERILTSGAELISLPPNGSITADIETTLGLLSTRKGALLALDGYDMDVEQHEIFRAAGHLLLVIDDTGRLERYDADILVNQNLGAARVPYRCDDRTLLLLGPDYAMLRPEFLSWRDRTQAVPDAATKILVTLGGSDPRNFTCRVIDALARLSPPGLEARVVVGSANPHLSELRKRAEAYGPNVQLLTRVSDMAELMAWADFAVSATGSTCWELAFMGLPALGVIVAENQSRIAKELHTLEVIENLGCHNEVSVESLAAAIASLQSSYSRRLRMSERGRALVDGRGAARVAEALLERSCRSAA